VTRSKAIKDTPRSTGKSANPTQNPISGKQMPTASQNFMGTGLVTHVPYYRIPGCLKHIVKGNCEFNYAQVCAKMPAPFTDFMNQELPQFVSQDGELTLVQPTEIIDAFNSPQEGYSRFIHAESKNKGKPNRLK
jgi:hypothetical protein